MAEHTERRTSWSDDVPMHCARCSETHRFTTWEAEQIVYALLAFASDLVIDDDARDWHRGRQHNVAETFADHMCLRQDVLSASKDIEVYAEWCESLTECRRQSTPEQPLEASDE